MKLYFLASLAIIMMTQIDLGASNKAIQCYSCDSKTNPDCGQSAKSKLKQFEASCDENAILFSLDRFTKLFNRTLQVPNNLASADKAVADGDKIDLACLKAEYTETNTKKKVVMRYCSSTEFKDCKKDMTAAAQGDATHLSCNICKTDLCNKSAFTSPSLALLLSALSFITCLFLLK